jgi:hypothetical protein
MKINKKGVALIIVGIIIVVFGVLSIINQGHKMENTIPVQAKITKVEKIENAKTKGYRTYTSYLTVEYNFDDKLYFNVIPSTLDYYQRGDIISIEVNPDNPEESTILGNEEVKQGNTGLVAFFGALLILAGIVVIIMFDGTGDF